MGKSEAALGWRTVMTDATGTTSWQYDGLGQPITLTTPLTGTVGYAYGSPGSRTRLDYPDGKALAYEYDALGRLSRVVAWDGQVTRYAYDLAGRLLESRLPNGVDTRYTYDDLGRLTLLHHATLTETLSAFTYTYDPNGNRVRAEESLPWPGAAPANRTLNSGAPGGSEPLAVPVGLDGPPTPSGSGASSPAGPAGVEPRRAATLGFDYLLARGHSGTPFDLNYQECQIRS